MAIKKLHLITAVVQHKLGEAALNAALKAGATGATYFYSEGTGVRQALGDAGKGIQAVKQVMFVLVPPAKTDAVLKALSETCGLNKPGQGVAYVQEVIKAVGFVPPAG